MEWLTIGIWLTFTGLAGCVLKWAGQRGTCDSFAARKCMHILLGVSVIPLVAYVRHWYALAIPVVLIMGGNAAANRRRMPGQPRWLTRLYPVAAAAVPSALILAAWEWGWLREIALAVLAMSVGDTLAAWAGRRWGVRRIGGSDKTWLGATANFGGATAVVFAAGIGLYQIPAGLAAPAALLAGTSCAVIEAALPGAWDNPAMVTAALLLLHWAIG